jgi:hypothetical protein
MLWAGGAQAGAAGRAAASFAGSWVGAGSGGNVFVAVVIGTQATRGWHKVEAYACDGKTGPGARPARIVKWLFGYGRANQLTVTSKDGYRLRFALSGATGNGTLTPPTPGASTVSFVARRATGKRAGLYRAQGSHHGKRYLAGLILLDDGRARGGILQGTQIQFPATWRLGTAHPTVTTGGLTLALTPVPTPIFPATQPVPTPI